MTEAFPAIEDLLPHRGAALLVEAVDTVTADGIACWGRVPPASPFAAEGWAPAFLGLEMGAQVAAVFEALRRGPNERGGSPRLGYLVGIRDGHLSADLPVGRRLRITVSAAGGVGPLGVYNVSVEHDGVEFLKGSLSTYAA